MTNSEELANELGRRCSLDHEHQTLVDGRAKEAARYPEPLCEAICMGLVKEIVKQEAKIKHLCSVNAGDTIGEDSEDEDGKTDEGTDTKKKRQGMTHEEDDNEYVGEAWDDVSGAHLDPKEVRRARMK